MNALQSIGAALTLFGEHSVELLGAVMVGVTFWVLRKAHNNRRNNIDLAFVLVDARVGSVTGQSFGMFIAVLASTWLLVLLAVKEQWDIIIAYGGLYMGTWGGVKVLNDLTAKPAPLPPTGDQTHVDVKVEK